MTSYIRTRHILPLPYFSKQVAVLSKGIGIIPFVVLDGYFYFQTAVKEKRRKNATKLPLDTIVKFLITSKFP